MSLSPDIFGRPAIMSTTLQEMEQSYLDECKARVLDELETAVVDRNGKRLKERDVITTMKTVSRL